MLEQAFQDVYTKFKLHFYQNVFQRFATREATLTRWSPSAWRASWLWANPPLRSFPA